MAFFHPQNLGESLLIYGAIVVLTGIVCGGITLVEARRQRRTDNSKSDTDKNINSKMTEK